MFQCHAGFLLMIFVVMVDVQACKPVLFNVMLGFTFLIFAVIVDV